MTDEVSISSKTSPTDITENTGSNATVTKSSVPVSQVIKNQRVVLLVVEDDKFLRELIVRRLVKEGFSVREAVDGESGLVALREDPPHLVLLDLILPGMGGFDVLEVVHKDPKLSAIPVVVVSNLGQREDVERARSLGARDFLVKAKYTPAEIVDRVREILHDTYIN